MSFTFTTPLPACELGSMINAACMLAQCPTLRSSERSFQPNNFTLYVHSCSTDKHAILAAGNSCRSRVSRHIPLHNCLCC